MGQIVLLAFGAAVFPALLACVAILLSRPSPRRLLFAFYVGGLIASVGSGLWILSNFDQAQSFLGNTASTPNPGASIAEGLVGLALAWAMISKRVKARADRWRAALARRRPKREKEGPSRMERTLNRATARVAFVVGAAINLPGPFYLLALGDIARGGYSRGQEVGLVLLFNAIMFLLVEVPLAGYLVRPDATAAMVGRLSSWLNANGLRVMGALVGVGGTTLLIQGLLAL